MTRFRIAALRESTFVETSFKACRLLPKRFSVSIAVFVYDVFAIFRLTRFVRMYGFGIIFDPVLCGAANVLFLVAKEISKIVLV